MSTHNIPRRSQPTPQNPIVITSDDEAEASDDSMEIDFASAHSRQQQIGFRMPLPSHALSTHLPTA